MVSEMAVSLVNAIQEYSKFDSKIFLFGKLLRNEIDEENMDLNEIIDITLEETLTVFV